jgi:hypothetical protein
MSKRISTIVLLSFMCIGGSRIAFGTESTQSNSNVFQWVYLSSNPELWHEVQSAFQDELTPDNASEGKDAADVYRYKYLQKIGVVANSAVVIIGHRPASPVSQAVS